MRVDEPSRQDLPASRRVRSTAHVIECSGVWQLGESPVPRELLQKELADDLIYHNEQAGFAIRSRGFDVFVTRGAAGPLVVMFAGQLHNPDELDRSGAAPGRASQLIAQLYLAKKKSFFPQMKGQFTLLIFDAGESRLLMVRDFGGSKPLYFSRTSEGFAFGTSVAELSRLGVPLSPNLDVLAWYFVARGCPIDPTMSFFERVTNVPTSHYGELTPSSATVQRYWDFDPEAREPGHYEDLVARFRKLFVRSVKQRLAGKAGILVSGGLDSSSIYCVARGVLGDEIVGVSYESTPGSPSYEDDYVQAIERQQGSRIDRVPISKPTTLHDAVGQIQATELPFLQWDFVLRAFALASEQECQTMFSGFMGDQLLMDDTYLVDLLAQGRLTQWLKDGAVMARHHGYRRLDVYRRSVRALLAWKCPESLKRTIRMVRSSDRGCFTQEFSRRGAVRGASRLDPRFGSFYAGSAYQTLLARNASLAIELESQLASWKGLTAFHPYMDRDLCSFVLAVPGPLLTRNGELRSLQRDAMRGILPEKVRVRLSKASFTSIGIEAAQRDYALLATLLTDRECLAVKYGILEVGRLPAWLTSVLHALEGGSGLAARRVIETLSLELWLRLFFGTDDQREILKSYDYSRSR